MLKYYNDIRTIIEMSVYIFSNLAFGLLFVNNVYFTYFYVFYLIVAVLYWVYRQYKIYRLKKDATDSLIVFPTQNDTYGQAYSLVIGILIMFWAGVYYLAFEGNGQYTTIAEVTGLFIFLYGFVNVPRGWLEIVGYKLYLCRVQTETDIRQLKQVVLKADKISMVNIYDETKNADYLKLDTTSAEKIKAFLEQQALKHRSEFTVVNNVSD